MNRRKKFRHPIFYPNFNGAQTHSAVYKSYFEYFTICNTTYTGPNIDLPEPNGVFHVYLTFTKQVHRSILYLIATHNMTACSNKY